MSTTNPNAVAVAPYVGEKQKVGALALMGSRFNVEPTKLLDTLRNTVFKNANNEQLMALVIVSNELNLNPFSKQIYAFPDKSGGIVPVVSVDGWLKVMNDQPDFDGIEYAWVEDNNGKPVTCTATIYHKKRSKPCVVTEYYAECYRNTDPWNKGPHRMLRHRATIQCIRVAFGLSAMDPDEAEVIAVASEPVPFTPQRPQRTRKGEANAMVVTAPPAPQTPPLGAGNTVATDEEPPFDAAETTKPAETKPKAPTAALEGDGLLLAEWAVQNKIPEPALCQFICEKYHINPCETIADLWEMVPARVSRVYQDREKHLQDVLDSIPS